MADIKLVTITYLDSENKIKPGDDRFGIYAYTQTKERIKTFFSNPNLTEKNKPMVNLSIVDDVIVGRSMVYPTLVKFDSVIIPCTTGSSLEVVSEYRHYDVGVDIVLKPVRDKENKQIIYADFSEQGINMFKAARFHVFRMPILMQPRKIKFLMQMLGLKGWGLKITSFLGNLLLTPVISVIDGFTIVKARAFDIKEVKIVPEWVNNLTLNDGHRFMEVHDRKWLQWALDNLFHNHPVNKNRFFIISRKGKNEGFFMIKERKCTIPSRNISDTIMTTVVEWGVTEDSHINEILINRFASVYCNPQTDVLRVATNDTSVLKKSKKFLFLPHGEHYIVHKDNTKQYKDSKEQSLWRLRFGYSDSIFN